MKEKSKLKAFASFYKPYKGLFALDMICAILIAAIDVAFPVVTKYVLDRMIPSNNYKMFIMMMVIILCTFILRAIMTYIITSYGHYMGVKIETDMRSTLFEHLQTLPFSFFDKTRTGRLMSRVLSDLFEISELAHHGPEDLVISFFTFLGAIGFMFAMEWRLAIVVCATIPLMILNVFRGRKRFMAASREVKQETASINADLESSISGVRVAKAFSNEEHEIERFDTGNEHYIKAKKNYYKAMGVFTMGMDFFTALPNLIVIGVGGIMVMRSGLNLSVLIAYTLYVNAFTSPIKRISQFVEQYSAGMSGFERYLELMNVESDIIDSPDAVTLTDVKGHIEYKDVVFSYDDDNVTVLNNINLDVKPGTTLAVVGPSGSGKTTLCHLLPRFYDTTAGNILVDGHNIKDVTLSSLRMNIGIVQQDVFLFANTIMENIRYGRLDATDEEIIEAAKNAGVHDDIMKMQKGYDTYVGERGMMLSGGQKQRISIARIFLKNPPILILDEATSSLDTYTEQLIQSAFDRLSKNRTTFVIAHRLSTIVNADDIVLLTNEGIKEQGTHEELLAENGEYAKLYQLQFGDQ